MPRHIAEQIATQGNLVIGDVLDFVSVASLAASSATTGRLALLGGGLAVGQGGGANLLVPLSRVSVRGYFFCGAKSTPGIASDAQSYSPSVDVATSQAAAFATTARTDYMGNSNGGALAYFSGGQSAVPAQLSSVEKVDQVTDVSTVLAGTLPAARSRTTGMTGRPSHGFLVGGAAGGVSTPSASIDRFNSSTETYAATAAVLGAASMNNSTAEDGVIRSYSFGGRSGAAATTIISRLGMDDETVSLLAGTLVTARVDHKTINPGRIAAYNIGGNDNGGPPAHLSTVDKFSYATETSAIATGAMPRALSSMMAMSFPSGVSFYGGGNDNAVGGYSEIVSLNTYADTFANVTATLPQNITKGQGVGQ